MSFLLRVAATGPALLISAGLSRRAFAVMNNHFR